MAIASKTSADGRELTVSVEGRFDFSSHQEFRQAYENVSPKPEQFVVDLKEASYLDSSALGMLLLLRDFAGGDDAEISIVNGNEDVKKILAISNFDQLFAIK